MGLFNQLAEYWNKKLARRKARRITQEYGSRLDSFQLERDGLIEFANWDNPLVKPHTVSQAEVDFFRLFITEGDFTIDIGANIGDTTVPISLATGKAGLTLAFDPNPFVSAVLERNSKLNGQKTNIISYRRAITRNATDFYYVSSEASFANGGISETKESIHGKYVFPEKILGVNLKQFLHENYPDRVQDLSFIKIDAEGYDIEIVRSIRDVLLNQKPTIIAESFGPATKRAKQEFFDEVRNADYEMFYTSDLLINAKFSKINSRDEFAAYDETINFIGVSKSNSTLLDKLNLMCKN
jgi:FkbM family methyltransferase